VPEFDGSLGSGRRLIDEGCLAPLMPMLDC
jgi:hypothetical protein